MRSKKTASLGLVGILILVSSFLQTGCKGDVSFSTASLSEAVICRSIDEETAKPVETADIFSSETPMIYCSVKLSNAPDDTLILSEWIYLKGDLEDVTDYKIDEYSLRTGGTTYIQFSLSRPGNGFPKGDYICRLTLNGKEKYSLPFKVE